MMFLPVWRVVCQRCRRKFEWVGNHPNDPPPAVCGRSCRRKLQERLKNDLDTSCPRPDKKLFRRHEEAQAFMAATHSGSMTMKAYRCRCGGIHIGHNFAEIIRVEEREDGEI